VAAAGMKAFLNIKTKIADEYCKSKWLLYCAYPQPRRSQAPRYSLPLV